MFEFKTGSAGWWPKNGKYNGYTKLEASEKAKEVIMSVKDKLYPPLLEREPWLDEDYVMYIVGPGGEENFKDQANRGRLRTENGVAGFEWRITN